MTAIPVSADFDCLARKQPDPNAGFTFSPVPEILADLRNGRMIVLVDAPDRENEGDLVIPAQMATPEAVNFMATHGRGLICLALSRARSQTLGLESMVQQNGSKHRTAFTKSIEARHGISTGISARDRARTIAAAIDSTKGADDLVSPGHVFPLVARDGGVLIRAGHTEASVDLARMAGLVPAAVICEIMSEDGRMARVPELKQFAVRHGFKACTIEDLIAYRLRNEQLVHRQLRKCVETNWGTFDTTVFVSKVDGSEHVAFVKGDIATPEPVLVRVQVDQALEGIVPGSQGSPPPTLADALSAVAAEKRGVVVVIGSHQPTLFSQRLAQFGDAELPPLREVETGIGSQILKGLGVSQMIVLTSHAPAIYSGIDAYGLSIVETRPLKSSSE
jgi:3,4-dihydroxy 2-butanone 4-phosphate synthase/GTP cyclohydrolase II